MKERHEPLKRVTLENRILLLLLSRTGQEDLMTVDNILTQGGMASEFQIRRNNITSALSELTSNGLVYSRTKHIKGKDRRRKAYFLTEMGMEETGKLTRSISRRYVQIINDEKNRVEWTLNRTMEEISSRLHRKVTYFEMLSRFISGSEVDLARISEDGISDTGPMVPNIAGFFGRKEEMVLILSSLSNGMCLLSVIGIAGQGKTTLVSEVVRRSESDAIWVELNPWISTDLVLDEIQNRFPGGPPNYSKGDLFHRARRISKKLGSQEKILVLDDLHRCSREMLEGVRALHDLCRNDGWTLVVISRERPAFYTRTEAMTSERILELQLEGLSRTQSFSLMDHLNVPETGREKIFEVTSGNPLAINLCALRPDADPSEIAVSFENFLEENVLKEISSEERKTLELLSCLDIPVSRQTLRDDMSVSNDSIEKLLARSLIRSYPDNSIDVHDSIKDGVTSLLSSSERRGLLKRIRDHHMERSRDIDMVQYLLISHKLEDLDLVRKGLIDHGEYLLGKGFISVAELALEIDNSGLGDHDIVRMDILRYDSASITGDEERGLQYLRGAGKLAEGLVRKKNDRISLELITMVLNRFAERAMKGGMHREVIKRLKKGLKIAKDSGARDQEARLISNIGCGYLDLGEPDMASGFFKDALDIFTELEDHRGEVICRLNLGRSLSMTMDLAGSLKQYLECIRSSKKAEMTRISAQANFRVGRLYWFVGDPQEALIYYSTAAVGYVREGDIDYSLMILNEMIEPCNDMDKMDVLKDTMEKMERTYKGRGWSYIKYRLGLERDAEHPDEMFFRILLISMEGKEIDEHGLREVRRIVNLGKERGKNDPRPGVLRRILLRKGIPHSSKLKDALG